MAPQSTGLSAQEAAKRLAADGPNELKEGRRIPLFTNVNLVIVVAVSIGLQVWSQHSVILGRFLKTSFMPLTYCLLLLAVGIIPLLTLEMVKVVRHSRRQRKTHQ